MPSSSAITGHDFSSGGNSTWKPLRTDAWHTDQPLHLEFPANWDVRILWPATPLAWTDQEIAETLDRPIGLRPIRESCAGKSRPLVIVDDLNRPTPAERVLPAVLRHFREAGIPSSSITILIATGTHGGPQRDSIEKKIGREAVSTCRVLVHDAKRRCPRIGYTSSGIPVHVNEAVLASDFVMGIGGVYPNYTAGFGGGSKLALGVLGFRSIKNLHFRLHGVGWGCQKNQPLRVELDEISQMIRLEAVVSLQINADREVIRATCGAPVQYYDDEVAFARQIFRAPTADGADVVISNAYPSDASLTAVLQKGTTPLRHANPRASRIVIASCSEGVGHHGLFPVIKPRYLPIVQFARRLSVMKPREIVQAVARRLERQFVPGPENNSEEKGGRPNPIWLYRPLKTCDNLPSTIPGYRVLDSWADVLAAVEKEQGTGRPLTVFLYPCAPLQSF